MEKWSADVKETFYYITIKRLNTDVELSFGPVEVFQSRFPLLRGGGGGGTSIWTKKPLEGAAEKEGRPRIKVPGVGQWLFNFQSDYLVPKPQLMIETRSITNLFPSWGQCG
ncbi:predicted protein [Sclerotinia sclerotiorum 1980 UF-70]|uniref:Uncharacterized protein n=1 Tax=Sclerotinia sclerotiorum (strain ATCC 18683 / 1980 / Ss-1) TaxID=665079 RepID=A7F9N6_SCLS1|nr:predicted protein [Sclerotinia sclerotiorum 1980 UF-70]EDO00447.1 predicted protein [Sclerotinia sclerotiorum 1980 UF-70]